MVEYASTFLMSFWTKARSAPNTRVTAPMTAMRLMFESPIWKPCQNTL